MNNIYIYLAEIDELYLIRSLTLEPRKLRMFKFVFLLQLSQYGFTSSLRRATEDH